MILLAVEHAQMGKANPFTRFTATLQAEQTELEELEDRLRAVLLPPFDT